MGNKGVRGGPLCSSPLVSLPARLWVIFSSFHGGAMNNLSLHSETVGLRCRRPPPLSHPLQTRSGRLLQDSISHPRFLLTVSALHTQSGFFLFLRALRGPEINWGCGWMTSALSFIKVWVLEVCWFIMKCREVNFPINKVFIRDLFLHSFCLKLISRTAA